MLQKFLKGNKNAHHNFGKLLMKIFTEDEWI